MLSRWLSGAPTRLAASLSLAGFLGRTRGWERPTFCNEEWVMHLGRDMVAVITGAGNGIGLAIATELVARGARVAIADIDAGRAREAAASLDDAARGYGCDVTDAAALEALAGAVIRDFGGVDIVFANAGVCIGGALLDADPREDEWLYDVNVHGAIRTVRAFMPALRARAEEKGAARIVLTGSENSVGLPTLGPSSIYTSTKHAILGIADALRRDLEGAGVAVSLFCPGLTATRIWNGRAARQERYGGPKAVSDDAAAQMTQMLSAAGQDPALTARICLDGVEQNEFLIFTDPSIRTLTVRRHAEVDAALDRLDERISAYAPQKA